MFDCVPHAWFRPQRKFRPHPSCPLGSTAWGKETLAIDFLTVFADEIPCFAVPICLQVYPLVFDCVGHA